MIVDLKPRSTKAKGRNGTFNAKTIALMHFSTDKEPKIWLEVWSRRTDGAPPVWIEMSYKDAMDLYKGLQKLLGNRR